MLSNVHLHCPYTMSMSDVYVHFLYPVSSSCSCQDNLHWEKLQPKPPKMHQVNYLGQLQYVHNRKHITMEQFTDGLQGNIRPVQFITALPPNSLCTHPLSADHGQAIMVPIQVSPQPSLPTAQSPHSTVFPTAARGRTEAPEAVGATLHYTKLHYTT